MGGSDPDISDRTDASALPPAVLARLNGELAGRAVVAWSELDLNDANRFSRGYAVLTDRDLITVTDAAVASLPIAQIQEVKIVEGLGLDRLRVLSNGTVATELRYTQRHRKGMTRLHRKLERRLPRKEGRELPPEWLDTVERQAEPADRLVVLEKGRIVEQGKHEELMNKEGGVYAKLHKTQMELSAQVAVAG